MVFPTTQTKPKNDGAKPNRHPVKLYRHSTAPPRLRTSQTADRVRSP